MAVGYFELESCMDGDGDGDGDNDGKVASFPVVIYTW